MDFFFGKIDALLEAQSHLQNIVAPYNPESENWHKGKTKIFLINEQRYRRLHSLINPQIVNLQMGFFPLTFFRGDKMFQITLRPGPLAKLLVREPLPRSLSNKRERLSAK